MYDDMAAPRMVHLGFAMLVAQFFARCDLAPRITMVFCVPRIQYGALDVNYGHSRSLKCVPTACI